MQIGAAVVVIGVLAVGSYFAFSKLSEISKGSECGAPDSNRGTDPPNSKTDPPNQEGDLPDTRRDLPDNRDPPPPRQEEPSPPEILESSRDDIKDSPWKEAFGKFIIALQDSNVPVDQTKNSLFAALTQLGAPHDDTIKETHLYIALLYDESTKKR